MTLCHQNSMQCLYERKLAFFKALFLGNVSITFPTFYLYWMHFLQWWLLRHALKSGCLLEVLRSGALLSGGVVSMYLTSDKPKTWSFPNNLPLSIQLLLLRLSCTLGVVLNSVHLGDIICFHGRRTSMSLNFCLRLY